MWNCPVGCWNITNHMKSRKLDRRISGLLFWGKQVHIEQQCGQPSVNLRKSIYKSEKYVRKYLERHQVGAVAELKISAL